MKIIDDEQMKIHTLNGKIYKSLYYKTNNLISKLLFFFVFFLSILVIILLRNKNKNKDIKLKTILSRKSIDSNKNEKNFYEKLALILDNNEVFENEIMNKHTTFNLGGPAKYFINQLNILF